MWDQVDLRAAEKAVAVTLWGFTLQKGPSLHLSWEELACSDGTPYPQEEWRLRARDLAVEFEFVRALLGGHPIKVNSAFRTPEVNRRVGGAKKSQHLLGTALDLAHQNPPLLLEACLYRYRNYRDSCQIRGLGLYSWGAHLDIRQSNRLARWSSSR